LKDESGDIFRNITGNLPRHHHTASKILWIHEQYPQAATQVDKWLLPKDYLRYKLTGQVATDFSDVIGTRLFDPVRGVWDPKLVKLVGSHLKCMPEILHSTETAGEITKEAEAETGLRQGIPVAVGCADGYATLLGADACSDTRVCLYLGTSAWITQFVSDPEVDPRTKIVPAPGGFHQWIGATACAGSSVTWLCRNLGITVEDELLREAEHSPPGANGLIFLPHLAGERGPQYEPHARGAYLGLTLNHTRSDLVRALLEGVSFQIRQVLYDSQAGRDIRVATAVGGGAGSAFWTQMLSDILGIELEVPEVIEAGSLGAAMIAGAAVGILEDPHKESARLFHLARKHVPDDEMASIYRGLYADYTKLDSAWLSQIRSTSEDLD
jgi:xylulokinase